MLTLVSLAKLFGITVDELLVDPNELPENPGKIERVMERALEKTLKRKADKTAILKLSSLLVWFLALALVVLMSLFDIKNTWMAFVYAIPTDAIVQLCDESTCSFQKTDADGMATFQVEAPKYCERVSST